MSLKKKNCNSLLSLLINGCCFMMGSLPSVVQPPTKPLYIWSIYASFFAEFRVWIFCFGKMSQNRWVQFIHSGVLFQMALSYELVLVLFKVTLVMCCCSSSYTGGCKECTVCGWIWVFLWELSVVVQYF